VTNLIARLVAAWRSEASEDYQRGFREGKAIGDGEAYDRGFVEGAVCMQRKISEHPDVYLLARGQATRRVN
jgi:hypothetical protein